MNWFTALFTDHGIAQTIVVYGCIIAIGILLGKIKIYNISLGITWVLFTGIAAAHFGISVDEETEHFLKEFGLILFVYSIGLQVGPSFFASLKKNALGVNALAAMVVVLGVVITIALFYASGNNMGIMTGILSGAVTNTPGLGAAQQAVIDMQLDKQGIDIADIGLAYAVSYPFGVLGIVLVMILLKKIFHTNIQDENIKLQKLRYRDPSTPKAVNLTVINPLLFNLPLKEIKSIIKEPFVISRMQHNGEVFTPSAESILSEGDVLTIVTAKAVITQLKLLIGPESEVNLVKENSNLLSRRIVVTNNDATHKTLADMHLLERDDFSITRVNRAGVEFVANREIALHKGDQVTVVGSEQGIKEVEALLGNSLKRLDAPDLAPIFTGIVIGIIFGSLPIAIPGIPVAVKIGLAGGPLIISLLLSEFGNRFYLINYTTHSANLIIREIGIVLFLASVGLGSGEHFVDILNSGQGWKWMAMGAVITVAPLLITGLVARYVFKKTFFEISGLLAGASTDPPALAFAIQTAGNDSPSVTYATVYPLTMILRILAAQLLVLFFT